MVMQLHLHHKSRRKGHRGFAALTLNDPAFADTDDWLGHAARPLKNRLQRRRAWKDTIEAAPQRQIQVLAMLEKAGVDIPRSGLGRQIAPPGLSNQLHATEERVWRVTIAAQLRRAKKVEIRAQGLQCFTFAATFARPQWIRATLDPQVLPEIRRFIQRQTKRLIGPYFVSGCIDVCPMRDESSGIRGWAFHVHLTILLGADEEASGFADIRKAYPYKSDRERGVPQARKVVLAYDPRGWDRYQDKLFQWGGVVQRITYVDPVSGNRRDTHQPPMTVAQKLEFARFMTQVNANDLMIWVGHRRYGDRVLEMPRNRSKSATPQSL